MLFSERLKYLRKSRMIPQKVIAEHLGISVTAYQYYEAGKNEPNIEKLIKLATLFDVSIDYLVGRTENPLMNIE